MQSNTSNSFLILLSCVVTAHLACVQVSAQNLVKNSSFEDFKVCPSKYGCLEEVVLFWSQPTYGTSDYFNSCSKTMPTEQNFIGEQSAFDGHGYAGFYAYGPKDYREYLTAELKVPLLKGQKYTFSFQVSLADKAGYAVNEFGVLFTSRPLNLHTKRNIPIDIMRRKGQRQWPSF